MGISALAQLNSEGPRLPLANLRPSQVWLLVRGAAAPPSSPTASPGLSSGSGQAGGGEQCEGGPATLPPARGGQSGPRALVPAHPVRWWGVAAGQGALWGQACHTHSVPRVLVEMTPRGLVQEEGGGF